MSFVFPWSRSIKGIVTNVFALSFNKFYRQISNIRNRGDYIWQPDTFSFLWCVFLDYELCILMYWIFSYHYRIVFKNYVEAITSLFAFYYRMTKKSRMIWEGWEWLKGTRPISFTFGYLLLFPPYCLRGGGRSTATGIRRKRRSRMTKVMRGEWESCRGIS